MSYRRRGLTNLREAIRDFKSPNLWVSDPKDEGNDTASLMVTERPEYLIINNDRFYPVLETATEIETGHCPMCKTKTSLFVVGLKDHPRMGQNLAVCQCDACKNIMVVQKPTN